MSNPFQTQYQDRDDNELIAQAREGSNKIHRLSKKIRDKITIKKD